MHIEEAVKLRLEQPARSAAHIAEMLAARHGVRIPERTLREQLQKRGLTRAELLRDQRTFGRYEAAAPNERWIADVLVGPFVAHPRAPGSQRARLFLIVDDHSRLVVHGRWVGNETLRAGQDVAAGATVHTDAWQGYRRLAKLGYDHQLKSLRAGRFLGEDVAEIVRRAHRVISNLKAWLQGTYHGVSGDHLQFYLDEFVFRFNRRRTPMAAFQTLLGLGSRRGPTPYRQIAEGLSSAELTG